MFKNLHAFLWLGLCAVMLVASCKKDDDQPSFTEEDLTIAGGWTFTARETNLDEDAEAIANGISDEQIEANMTTRAQVQQILEFSAILIETVEDCEANESYVFETSGSITVNEVPDCDEIDIFEAALTHTWSLDGNTLTIRSGTETVDYQILRLSENELVIETVSEPNDVVLFNLTTTERIRLKFFFAANR